MAKNIIEKIDYLWRLIATAISFAVFGASGVLLWLLVFPLLSLLPGDREQKARRAQFLLHGVFFAFIRLMYCLGLMSYEVRGQERLNRPGQLIVANHPSLIDAVFLLSRIRQASCIVKASLWRNPAMRGPILHSAYISNADAVKMLADCVACLKSGGAMLIFPEGTRSVPGQAYCFQRGAAAIALQADCIVTPVLISCRPGTLAKGEAWYRIPQRRFHLKMSVGDDIKLDDFRQLQPRSIAVRRFTLYLQDYFTQQRECHEHDGN